MDAPPATHEREAQNASQTQTPAPLSPPRSKTPPTVTGKRAHSDDQVPTTSTTYRSGSEPVNAVALNKALKDIERSGLHRVSTPTASPSRKRQKIQTSDRFIPNRAGQDLSASYNLLHEDGSPATPSRHRKKGPSDLQFHKVEANRTYSSILRSEMFNDEVPQMISDRTGSRGQTPPVTGATGASSYGGNSLTPSTPHKNLFSYGPQQPVSLTPRSISRSERGPNINARSEIYSLSPVKHSSQTMLLSPRKTPRQVSKVPYKVLDAPDLADDFYLNLVDWGSNDMLAVGLGASVYLWSRESGKVTTLCTLEGDIVTSVGWIQRGTHLAIGTSKGVCHIWDCTAGKRLRTMTGHSSRISSLAWNAHILSTGSRDRSILHRDVRSSSQYLRRLSGHKQEVCGLKWNSETEQLASGGNDNKIFIWDKMEERWQHRWGEQEGGHKAAVKAIAWNPHQRGVLASGGGTADRCIKFWNTISAAQTSATRSIPAEQTNLGLGLSTSPMPEPEVAPQIINPHLISSHDTGSQVCNLLFSQRTSELVSTHGYSQHAINIWKYPSMNQVVSLTGHTYRVLYLSMSPDGAIIVTGAGDETLRFWDVFSKQKGEAKRGIVGEWGIIR
ncbi:Putative WD40/YVTN repeat-like-containing domain superfamily, The WD repeat Cdc20/Fizzy family [Septoria linicola]|uniref:WD40/YVTN repeat-like-containing domain superfamily, The WD repeat Cdc20/Fizzy family n=1 Tax=Septoria linicola TaxID=215465 RepID=A0A9Q9EF77_9PEZI|nr:Putative WD40/YVTN repeat-like-containing domain superfamily, The WD repeat Cdc20/Fizzy family [Septoria linicola]